jgi:purine-binding chemotaxis protein CheW
MPDAPLDDRTREVAAAFDRTYMEPPQPPDPPGTALLGIPLGEARYALRVAQIGGIHPAGPIVALPHAHPAFRGLASVRGRLVSVFDLAAALGHPRAAIIRWLVLTAGPAPIALAVGSLGRHMHVAPSALAPGADAVALAPDVLVTGRYDGRVIDLARVRASLVPPSPAERPTS